MPDQLIDFHAAHVASRESALGAARDALATAQADQDGVRADEKAAADALTAARRQEAAVRRALAEASMPAEVDALAEDLETALIAVRAAKGETLDVSERRKRVEVAQARAQSRLAEARTQLAEALAGQQLGAEAHAEREQWRAAVDDPPISTLQSDAADATDPGANPPFVAARDRIEHDIPDDLRAFARARGDEERQKVADERTAVQTAESDLIAELEAAGGADGAADAAELRFARREEALHRLVADGPLRLERARRVFETIASSDPLPASVLARIGDAAVADPARTAMGNRPAAESTRDDAQALVDAKATDLEDRIAVVEAAGDDPDTDAQVIDLRNDLEGLEDARDLAQADLDALDDDIDRWEATVPDSTWRQLAAFDDAVADLADLAATDPTAVRTEMNDAETALFHALTEADRHESTARELDEALFDERQRLAALVGQRDAQVLSAVRGDVP